MFVIPTFTNAAPAKGLGMWVWSKSSFSTEEARQQLISFCVDHRINHLDIHIEISSDKEKMVLPDADALKDLIRLAGQYNITTAALRGSPKMFFSNSHTEPFSGPLKVISPPREYTSLVTITRSTSSSDTGTTTTCASSI